MLLGSSSIRLVSLSKEANHSFEVCFSVEVLYLVSRVIPIEIPRYVVRVWCSGLQERQ